MAKWSNKSKTNTQTHISRMMWFNVLKAGAVFHHNNSFHRKLKFLQNDLECQMENPTAAWDMPLDTKKRLKKRHEKTLDVFKDKSSEVASWCYIVAATPSPTLAALPSLFPVPERLELSPSSCKLADGGNEWNKKRSLNNSIPFYTWTTLRYINHERKCNPQIQMLTRMLIQIHQIC